MAVVVGLSVYAYQLWMGPKPLRVPFAWRSLAAEHQEFAKGLAIRTAIGRMLLDGDRGRMQSILRTVDAVLAAMAEVIEERGRRGVEEESSPETVKAIADLQSIFDELNAEFDEETAGALDRARERLAASTADLKQTNQVRRELERDLDS